MMGSVWKFECIRSRNKLEEALRCLVCDWRTTVPGVHLPLRQREVQKFVCSVPSCDKGEEYSACTLGMDQPPSAGRIWAPDDKARTMAWDVSEQDYLMAGLKQMARDTMHWKMVPDGPETVAELYEGLHSLVGRKERGSPEPEERMDRIKSCRTPTARSSQSAMTSLRCGEDGPVFISWWHHPARPQLRLLAVWLCALRMRHSSMKRCGSDILETLQHLLQYSEQRGIHSVMLRESRRRRACLSPKKHVTHENWKCWPVRCIVALLHLCLSQPFATFRNSVWMQRQGVPISGLVNGALCSVLLGFAEFRHKAMEPEEARLPGHVLACTARLRHVDDQSGSRPLTAMPAWKNSSVECARRVSSSLPCVERHK